MSNGRSKRRIWREWRGEFGEEFGEFGEEFGESGEEQLLERT